MRNVLNSRWWLALGICSLLLSGCSPAANVPTPEQNNLEVIVKGQGKVDPNGGIFDHGSKVILIASPVDPNAWYFKQWEGASVGINPKALIIMNDNKKVWAVFRSNTQYTLSKLIQGQGTVTADPPDNETYNVGDNVTLTATPADGWRFSQWKGNAAGTDNQTLITMNGNKTVTAVFQSDVQYALTTIVQGQGTVNPADGNYSVGDNVTLTATPDVGWHFLQWEDNATGTDNQTLITMNDNKTVTAVFRSNTQYTLSKLIQGQGTVTADPPDNQTYNVGDNVTLTATPAIGWHFLQWKDNATGTNPQTLVTMSDNKTVTAVFQSDVQYTLTKLIQGQGTVTADPNTETYNVADNVTLKATPAISWYFLQWEDNATGTDNQTLITMNDNKTVTAVFRHYVQLTTIVQGQGAVTANPANGNYKVGDNVTLTATPTIGWYFLQWEDNATGTDNQTLITMNDNKTVTAVFRHYVQLTTIVQGQGAVTANPANGNYKVGDNVTLTATPAVGWHFLQWQDNATGTDNQTLITMNDNKTVTAVFRSNVQYTLTKLIQGQGTVTADPNTETYNLADNVTLKATPADGWHFSKWEGNATGTDSQAHITMNDNKTVTAVFELGAQYTLTTIVQGHGTVNPANGAYNAGDNVTLTATPDAGWYFLHWEDNATGTDPQTLITMNDNKTVTAVFRSIVQYTLTRLTQGQGTVTSDPNTGTYNVGDNVTLTATPAGGWFFIGWGNPVNITDNTTQITMNSSIEVNALFVQNLTQVKMDTSKGSITIELDRSKAPITVDNFLRYVNEGFYDGRDTLGATIFHRVIPNFMIQGGGFLDNMTQKVTHSPIIIESNNGLLNVRGTIAMARTNDPNSATCQFFINVVDNPSLNYSSISNPGYTVFGSVLSGMDVADTIVNVPTQTVGQFQNIPVDPITITSVQVLP